MVVEIRRARADDMPALIDMARDMHAESPRFSVLPFSAVKAVELVRVCIAADTMVALVAEDGGEVIGMMAGYAAEHFFSEAKSAGDFVLYVAPEYRGGRAALRLIKAFEEWAWAAGADEVVLGANTGVDIEQTMGLYEKVGYTACGRTALKRKG